MYGEDTNLHIRIYDLSLLYCVLCIADELNVFFLLYVQHQKEKKNNNTGGAVTSTGGAVDRHWWRCVKGLLPR
jgi:hypothetical protein